MEALQLHDEYTRVKNRIIETDEFDEVLSEDGLYVSEDEYQEKYYVHPDFNYEWNNGYLEEKPVTDFEGSLMYQWFCTLLQHFLQTHPIARTMNLEMGFRLTLPSGITIRKPDLAVILNTNIIQPQKRDCTFKGVCDICVESLSHADRNAVARDTIFKKREYEIIGVKEYYILDARQEKTAFYKSDKHGCYVKIRPAQKDIIRSEALPGFQFRISDLYKQPSLLSMTEDKVYQKFLMPYYQQELQLRNEAEKRAKQEHKLKIKERKLKIEERKLKIEAEKRAEQERKLKKEAEKRMKQERKLRDMATERAERMAEKLREIGISVEDI